MFKFCGVCKLEKDLSFFGKTKYTIDGYRYLCNPCRRTKEKKYNTAERRKKRYVRDKEKERIQQKIYFQNNKEIWNNYSLQQYKNNPLFKLKLVLRNRVNKVLNGAFKMGSAVEDLGCTPQELKLYLESKWKPGMSWENHAVKGWHVDHIVPLASFDLTDRQQFLKACHYSNLQPLWAIDNLIKGAKI